MVFKSKVLGDTSLIFLTVGSTQFPFTRLFIAIDKALEELKSQAKLVIQADCSPYKWKYRNIKLFNTLYPKEIDELLSKADKVIAHGGVGTLYSLSKNAKNMPLIVARLHKYREHVNDHQLEHMLHVRSQFPNSYKDFFLVDQDIQNSINKYIQGDNKKNVLGKYLFISSSKNTLIKKLTTYIKSL